MTSDDDLRLGLKRQSVSSQTVLLRTTLRRTIIFYPVRTGLDSHNNLKFLYQILPLKICCRLRVIVSLLSFPIQGYFLPGEKYKLRYVMLVKGV